MASNLFSAETVNLPKCAQKFLLQPPTEKTKLRTTKRRDEAPESISNHIKKQTFFVSNHEKLQSFGTSGRLNNKVKSNKNRNLVKNQSQVRFKLRSFLFQITRREAYAFAFVLALNTIFLCLFIDSVYCGSRYFINSTNFPPSLPSRKCIFVRRWNFVFFTTSKVEHQLTSCNNCELIFHCKTTRKFLMENFTTDEFCRVGGVLRSVETF